MGDASIRQATIKAGGYRENTKVKDAVILILKINEKCPKFQKLMLDLYTLAGAY